MKKTITAIFIITISLISCQKDFTVEDTPPTSNSTTIDDSTLLSMYVEIDTSATVGLDTLSKAIYGYDNLKRLIKYDWVYFRNGVNTTPVDLRWKNLYFYNGIDTLPFKEIDSTFEQGNITTETIYHTYFNGQLILDSTTDGFKNKYTYFPTKTVDTLIGFTPSTPSSPSVIGYKVTYRQINNSNVASEKDSLFLTDFSTNPSTFYLYFNDNYTATYDIFLNPLYKYRSLKPISFDGYFPKLDEFGSKSRNNMTNYKLIRIGAGNNLNEQYVTTYIYKTNGYPKIGRTTDVLNSANSIKSFYYYTN